MKSLRTLVVPYDFSEPSQTALRTAARLACRLGASLHLLHVIELPAFALGAFGSGLALPLPAPLPCLRERSLQALRDAAHAVDEPPAGIEAHVVEGGAVAERIREAAMELHADLIIMGTHARTGLARLLFGDVAATTVRKAPCPVLTVRAPA